MFERVVSKLKIPNGKSMCFLIMTLLILGSVSPIIIAHTNAQVLGEGNYPDIPGGIPENALQYNKTDISPSGEVEQVKGGEPALFRYRNMTMLMNCSQNCNLVVTVDSELTPKTLGLDIEANQTMTLTINMSSSPLQGAQVAERALNFYLGLEPNAELQLNVQFRLLINQTELNQELGRVVDASELTWMYWNGRKPNGRLLKAIWTRMVTSYSTLITCQRGPRLK